MIRRTISTRCRLTLGLVLALAAAPASVAGTLTGVVRNGTTGAAAAGVDVVLIQLQGGMQPVATTKTDAKGHFQFDRPEVGAAPMLVRVPYRGVNYHQPAPPGAAGIEVDIYEPTPDSSAVKVTAHAIALQAHEGTLQVEEIYSVQNSTSPPVAYFRTQGTFEFVLPENAQQVQASASGASGMPVVQGLIDEGKNRQAIAFAFRPGENRVQISYQLAYPSNQTTLHTVSLYPAERVAVFAPPTMQVTSTGFAPAGSDQGWSVYARTDVAAGAPLDISISGQGSISSLSNSGADGQDSSGGSRSDAAGETTQALPGQVENVKWILVSVFAAVFVALGFLLWRRSPLPASAAGSTADSVRLPPETTSAAKSHALADLDGHVRGGLDELKDTLFKLELRRQAGTISEEEYARERGRAEKILRDLVRG
jgi:hypothetical protein